MTKIVTEGLNSFFIEDQARKATAGDRYEDKTDPTVSEWLSVITKLAVMLCFGATMYFT